LDNPDHPSITISIVSHGQLDLVKELLKSLWELESRVNLEIIITENRSSYAVDLEELTSSQTNTILNQKPMGFAQNHNRAFRNAKGEYFIVLNPDIVFKQDVFTFLIEDIESRRGDIVAPIVLESDGTLADSFRDLPKPTDLIRRRFRSSSRKLADIDGEFIQPDWLAGMFLFMKQEVFRDLNGFEEKYYMYFEDVDFGCRARLAGHVLLLDTRCSIIHNAKRASQRNLLHTFWHLRSAYKFFTSTEYKELRDQNKCDENTSSL
jgi:GT2 family glycosyltransferase